jgi:hypothetical protein
MTMIHSKELSNHPTIQPTNQPSHTLCITTTSCLPIYLGIPIQSNPIPIQSNHYSSLTHKNILEVTTIVFVNTTINNNNNSLILTSFGQLQEEQEEREREMH